ncbi:hypothetical protein DEJ36_12650 [Curtobacterium sp. MCPF17_052]|nr:hypothetical protein [Curtobacterium sp. MCPF17_052]WIB11741.1 hypothetical protein DEJ36_12650 [Curtobacterium sp. MCPF17_052]
MAPSIVGRGSVTVEPSAGVVIRKASVRATRVTSWVTRFVQLPSGFSNETAMSLPPSWSVPSRVTSQLPSASAVATPSVSPLAVWTATRPSGRPWPVKVGCAVRTVAPAAGLVTS